MNEVLVKVETATSGTYTLIYLCPIPVHVSVCAVHVSVCAVHMHVCLRFPKSTHFTRISSEKLFG